MKPSKKLLFFGTEDFSLPSLIALVENGFDIVAVVTKPDSARGRSKQLVEPAVKQYARLHTIPVHQPTRLADSVSELAAYSADAGVLVSYGKILPQALLDVFSPLGIINLHPSLLPKYRGPAPIEAAILHGDTTTGITIMQLTAGMDEGPLFAQESYKITGHETKPALAVALSNRGADFLVETLPAILDGELIATPQKDSAVSYTSLISKNDGILDPLTDTAMVIERKVRAYRGFPKTRLKIKNTDVIITSVNIVKDDSSEDLVIHCANDTYLSVQELVAPSGKTMSGQAFKRGYLA